MAVQFTYIHELQVEKMQLVQSLTDLNGQRILSENRLAGIDIDKARCTAAIESGDIFQGCEQELRQLEEECNELIQARAVIDVTRGEFEQKILEIDKEIVDLIESADQS